MAAKICAAVGDAKMLPETEQERKEGPTKPANIGSLMALVEGHIFGVLKTYCPPPAKPIVVTWSCLNASKSLRYTILCVGE
jgi:hypothetical protein